MIGSVVVVGTGVFAGISLTSASELDRSSAPPVPPATTPSAPPSLSRPPDDPISFRFSETIVGRPITWDRCRITYLALADHVPEGGLFDLDEAFRRLGDATGFEFVSEGISTEDPQPAVVSMDRDRQTEGADIVVAWLPHRRFEAVGDLLDVRGRPIAWASAYPEDAGIFASFGGALVVLDVRFNRITGFDTWFSHGATLLHELGHALGLDHVDDPSEIMYDGEHPDLDVGDLGNGDREGLHRLSVAAGCS